VPGPLWLTWLKPGGSWSITWTPAAAVGPPFVNVSANTTVSPTLMPPLPSASTVEKTDLSSDRSELWPSSTTTVASSSSF